MIRVVWAVDKGLPLIIELPKKIERTEVDAFLFKTYGCMPKDWEWI